VLGAGFDTGHRKFLWLVLALAALPGMRIGRAAETPEPSYRRAA
jgi:hypothetical protein